MHACGSGAAGGKSMTDMLCTVFVVAENLIKPRAKNIFGSVSCRDSERHLNGFSSVKN